MDKNKFFLFSFFLSCFVGLVGFAMVKTVFLLYDLPAWVSSSALKVFLSLGMSCLSAAGILYGVSLWFTEEWKLWSCFYKIRCIVALGLIMINLFMSFLALYTITAEILALL